MTVRRLLSLTLLLAAACSAGRAVAIGFGTLSLSATRSTLLADGKHTTVIRADVRDSSGRPVSTGVSVQFQTTSGTLSQTIATAINGMATVNLTSSPIAGVAHVTASVPGQSVSTIDVLFTDDPEATFEGNNYMAFSASSYLSYSATDRIIDINGRNAGAKMAFRNLSIIADRIQVRCDDLVIRARDNITIRRGKTMVRATRLYYSIQTSQGFALAEDETGRLRPVTLSGDDLRAEPMKTQIPGSYINPIELQVKLVVVAKGITFFPGDRIQFRRPRFFQDQVQVMALPFYEMPIGSTELFSDQFISVGTSGLGLELPFYFELSPRSTGIVYLRHQQQLGRGYYATEPGWSIDLLKGYSNQGDHRYEGQYGFTGLTRSDWGFRWSHNQEFNSTTQGSVYVDFPHHDSVFTSTNLSKQYKAFRLGGNFSAGQAFATTGTTTLQSNVYAETVAHRLGGSRTFQYTLGTTYNTGHTITNDPNIIAYNDTTETVNMRAFTRPLLLDKRTTLTNSFSVGHIWSQSQASGLTTLASLSLDRSISGGGSLNLTYDFVNQPANTYVSDGKHRVSATYNMQGVKRFQAAVIGSTYIDAADLSLLADVSYRLDGYWRFLTSVSLERFNDQSYSDMQFTVGRRLGARELQLTYSTLLRRFSFDLTATRF